MREVRVTETEQDRALEIEFRFKSLDQLLDPDDPSPLPTREITEFAEEYIVSYLNGYNVKKIAAITIGLPRGSLSPGEAKLLPEAIRRHFSFRLADPDNDMRVSRREGWTSITVALFTVPVALVIAGFAAMYLTDAPLTMLTGLTTILIWVTVWEPTSISSTTTDARWRGAGSTKNSRRSRSGSGSDNRAEGVYGPLPNTPL